MITRIADADVSNRIGGTAAAVTAAILAGAAGVRVHDVAVMRHVLRHVDGEPTDEELDTQIDRMRELDASLEAVVDGDVRLTWPELDDRINRLCSALADRGVGHGDVILWMGQNSHRILECLGAAAKTGAAHKPATAKKPAAAARISRAKISPPGTRSKAKSETAIWETRSRRDKRLSHLRRTMRWPEDSAAIWAPSRKTVRKKVTGVAGLSQAGTVGSM